MDILKLPMKMMKGEKTISYLPVDKIRPNPYHNRKQLNRSELHELAHSIQLYGVLQPILVRRMSNNIFELISGERRLRGAEIAKLTLIPAIIMRANDLDSSILAMVENIHRLPLNFIEESQGYKNIMEDYSMSSRDLADDLGKSHLKITNKLRMLRLEDIIQKNLLDHNFTEEVGEKLLRLPHQESRLVAMEKMINYNDEAETIVENIIEKLTSSTKKDSTKETESNKILEKHHVSDFRVCTNTIKQCLDLIKKSGMEVCYSKVEGDEFCDVMISIRRKTNSETA